jgi:D-alanyl-D-alanine carboxypeptidase
MVPVTSRARIARVLMIASLFATALVTGGEIPSRAATSRLFVAFSPSNMPAGMEAHLDAMPGVEATTVHASTDWMTHSEGASGKVKHDPPSNFGFPMEVIVVQKAEYMDLVRPPFASQLRKLRAGSNRMVISEPASRLRNGGEGLRMTMTGRVSRVVGVAGTAATQGYEGIKAPPIPGAWPNFVRFVIIRANESVSREELAARIRQRLDSNDILALRSEFQVKYLRYGASAVRPMSAIKLAMGEFPGRPVANGRIEQLASWRANNITTAGVPILGNVTCHRKLFPQARGALGEIKRKGLAGHIRVGEYAGCYNSRYVATIPSTRVSRHSWGIAFDINARSNCLGCKPTMNARVVKIFEKWGFVWGGRFALPDGMHFEWIRFP